MALIPLVTEIWGGINTGGFRNLGFGQFSRDVLDEMAVCEKYICNMYDEMFVNHHACAQK